MNETSTVELEITADEMSPAPWVRLFDQMISEGITFGTFYPQERLEKALMCRQDLTPLKFGAAVRAINDKLAVLGYYLSQRDQNRKGYIVVTADRAESVADSGVRASFVEIARAIALFNGIASNPAAQLTERDKKRLESKAEKNAMRLALMKRPVSIGRKVGLLK